jgi:hypothetical protein
MIDKGRAAFVYAAEFSVPDVNCTISRDLLRERVEFGKC